jgi:plasmid stabilization system protein ParE
MSRTLVKSRWFQTDVALSFGWYVAQAGEVVAWRFFAAVDHSLAQLTQFPKLGRERRFKHAELRKLCSYRAEPPFDDHLIFYSNTEGVVSAERLIRGQRDLTRRLRETPGTATQMSE